MTKTSNLLLSFSVILSVVLWLPLFVSIFWVWWVKVINNISVSLVLWCNNYFLNWVYSYLTLSHGSLSVRVYISWLQTVCVCTLSLSYLFPISQKLFILTLVIYKYTFFTWICVWNVESFLIGFYLTSVFTFTF